MGKVTLLRALGLQKLTEKKIDEFLDLSKTAGPLFLSCIKENDSLVYGTSLNKDEFTTKAKRLDDEFANLIKLETELRFKISKANNVNSITIGGVERTITETIAYRDLVVKQKERLLQRYRREATEWAQLHRRNDEEIDSLVRANAKQTLAPGATDADIASRLTELNVILSKGRKLSPVDPIGLNAKIEALDKEINDFRSEVDLALNEANCRIEIDIEG
jgi:hypothetical protein